MVGRGLGKGMLLALWFAAAGLLVMASSAMAGGTKQDICHLPPGNPANAHTITISDNAIAAHAKHGDFVNGACDVFCAEYCDDDGDACTVADVGDDCLEVGCPLANGVDCDDDDPYTIDSCDPAEGCLNVRCPCFAPDDICPLTAAICSINAGNGQAVCSAPGACPPNAGSALVDPTGEEPFCNYDADIEEAGVCVGHSARAINISPDEAHACFLVLDGFAQGTLPCQ